MPKGAVFLWGGVVKKTKCQGVKVPRCQNKKKKIKGGIYLIIMTSIKQLIEALEENLNSGYRIKYSKEDVEWIAWVGWSQMKNWREDQFLEFVEEVENAGQDYFNIMVVRKLMLTGLLGKGEIAEPKTMAGIMEWLEEQSSKKWGKKLIRTLVGEGIETGGLEEDMYIIEQKYKGGKLIDTLWNLLDLKTIKNMILFVSKYSY